MLAISENELVSHSLSRKLTGNLIIGCVCPGKWNECSSIETEKESESKNTSLIFNDSYDMKLI